MPTKKTRAQIARKMYGASLSELSGGKKAAVTKAFDKQDIQTAPTRTRAVSAPTAGAGYATVKFGRPGVNGVKECIVEDTTTMGDALDQAGVNINKTKEGVLAKADGSVIMYNNIVKDGAVYMIVPGIDSSNF